MGRRGGYQKEKEIKTKQRRRDSKGKKSKLAKTTGLNSSGSPASSPELTQGYNYPPKRQSIPRLESGILGYPSFHWTEPPHPSLATASPLSSSCRCLMAIADNDGALICKKDGFQIRSMFELLSTMSQFTGSIGYERLYSDTCITQWPKVYFWNKVRLCYVILFAIEMVYL